MTNVVFLDIDGVLLPFGSYDDWCLAEAHRMPENFMADTAKRVVGIEALQEFCVDNEAWIVLISTWRYVFPTEDLKQFLVLSGLKKDLHQDWIAAQPHGGYGVFQKSKKEDIDLWLGSHPEVKNWWIIDDVYQGISSKHWIKTNPYQGLINADLLRHRDELAE